MAAEVSVSSRMATLGSRLSAVRSGVIAAREKAAASAAACEATGDALERIQRSKDAADTRTELHRAAVDLLSTVEVDTISVVLGQISALVTAGLVTTFGQGYSFRVENRILRGVSSLDMFVVHTSSDGAEVEREALDSHGGGLSQVVSFLLRVVIVALGGGRRTLILDEPFGHLSSRYLPRLAEFVRQLCERHDIQIIMVSHEAEMAEVATHAYRLCRDENGVEALPV